MRVAKSVHLVRLLQTQDVLLSTLLFASLCLTAWALGHFTAEEVSRHLQRGVFVLLASIAASADSRPKLHNQSRRAIVRFAVRYSLIVVLGVLSLIYFAGLDYLDRLVIGAFAVLLPVVLVLDRMFLRWWYLSDSSASRANYLRVLMIGSGSRARRFAAAYAEDSEWGIDIIGMLDPEPGRVADPDNGIPVLGAPDQIKDILASRVVDEVIICLPRSQLKDGVQQIVDACVEEAVCVKLLADSYDIKAKAVTLERIGCHPLLCFEPVSQAVASLITKRILDLLISIVALAMLAPVFALIAIAIKLDSPGPVFFLQQRVGLNKRVFPMIKFRSMMADAEQRQADVEHLNEVAGPIFKIRRDPRVTRVGRVLRRTSLDELPQLINVVRGEMSLIGPRPMSVRDVSHFSLAIQRRRFSVLPGIACLREISGRSKLSFDRWLELDLKYIDERSLWLDLKILLRVIPAVVRGDGAS